MYDELLREWGSNLRTRRGSLTQERLAELSGVDQSTISRIEHAKLEGISDTIKLKLAGALCCTIGDLFPYPNVKPPAPNLAEAV